MTMRLLLAATVASGLIVTPAAFAKEAMAPAAKSKTHKAAKAHKKTNRAPITSGKMKKNDNMMGEPYSTQKDEMTR
jgi:hypothetical protein